jgi:hypothetical protein
VGALAGADQLDPDQDTLPQLATRVSATDLDLPSISLPLAHEHRIQQDLDSTSRPGDSPGREVSASGSRVVMVAGVPLRIVPWSGWGIEARSWI